MCVCARASARVIPAWHSPVILIGYLAGTSRRRRRQRHPQKAQAARFERRFERRFDQCTVVTRTSRRRTSPAGPAPFFIQQPPTPTTPSQRTTQRNMRHGGTGAQRSRDTKSRQHRGIIEEQRHRDTRHRGAEALRCRGTESRQHRGVEEQRHRGTGTLATMWTRQRGK